MVILVGWAFLMREVPLYRKPDESRMWRFYLGLGADALLVRSSGMLQKLLELRDDPGIPENRVKSPPVIRNGVVSPDEKSLEYLKAFMPTKSVDDSNS